MLCVSDSGKKKVFRKVKLWEDESDLMKRQDMHSGPEGASLDTTYVSENLTSTAASYELPDLPSS